MTNTCKNMGDRTNRATCFTFSSRVWAGRSEWAVGEVAVSPWSSIRESWLGWKSLLLELLGCLLCSVEGEDPAGLLVDVEGGAAGGTISMETVEGVTSRTRRRAASISSQTSCRSLRVASFFSRTPSTIITRPNTPKRILDRILV